MNIFENPFYILGAAPQNDRRKIMALADEKVLISDAECIAEARSVLTTPSKRIHAEMRWFPELSAEETAEITNYFVELKQGGDAKEPEMMMANSLATLNIKLYTFPLKVSTDFFQIKYAILEISRLYTNLDTEILREEINHDRILSGFPKINSAAEIEDEMPQYRGEIRRNISSRLMELPQQEYVEIITLFSEKYSTPNDRCNGHAVLEDIITDYELHMTPEIECQKHQIIEKTSFIEKRTAEIRTHDAVSDIIESVSNWDALAQPLQLVARGRGQKHEASEEIARSIRELAVVLHNDYGETEEAIRLTEALKQFFAELSDFEEKITDDIDTLHRLKNEKAADEREEQESVKRNRMDKRYFATIRADKVVVPPFCTCCMKSTSSTETVSTSVSQQSGNRKHTRTISMNMPICPECSAHRRKATSYKWLVLLLSVTLATASVPLISMERDTSKGLLWTMPFIVAITAYVLSGLIVKLPLLGVEHSTTQQSIWLSGIGMTGNTMTFSFSNWRYAKLFAAANSVSVSENEYRNRAKSRAYLKAIDHPFGIGFLAITLTAAILILFGSSLVGLVNTPSTTTPAQTTQKPSTSYASPKTTTKPSTTSASGTQTKQQKQNALEAMLNTLKDEIADMEDQLTSLSDDIDYYEKKYYETYSDTDADQYNNAIDEYNALWEEYDQSIDDYNDMVNEYNSLLN